MAVAPPVASPERPVLLVHGMGRTPWSMRRLGAALRADGHTVTYFGYLCAMDGFATIAKRLAAQLAAVPPLVAVGHSLGGLLLRAACDAVPAPARPLRLVMLGTPNHSSRWARAMASVGVYRAITGDCGQLLADPARVAALPLPSMPTLVIAGDAGPRWPRTPTADVANDLVVAVDETRLAGCDHVVLPLRHTYMMHAPAVIARVAEACRLAQSDLRARESSA